MNVPTIEQLQESQRSSTCPICGKWKRADLTLCAPQYISMPHAMKRSLFTGQVNAAYREAFIEVMKRFNVQAIILPK